MMDFEIKIEKPRPNAAKISALVMGLSYFVGGFFPLLPYFIIADLHHALFTSIGVSIVILLVFGYVKAVIIGTKRRDAFISALQTLVVGVVAAATSYAIVRTVNDRFGEGTVL
jgi:predicted membrane protein (TIGR00267 family)